MNTAEELARYFASSIATDRWNDGAGGMIKLPVSDLIRSLTRLVNQCRREGAGAMRERCVEQLVFAANARRNAAEAGDATPHERQHGLAICVALKCEADALRALPLE